MNQIHHMITFNGTPKVKPFFPFDLTTSYDAYEHGGSLYLDGVTDYLTAAQVKILQWEQVNLYN